MFKNGIRGTALKYSHSADSHGIIFQSHLLRSVETKGEFFYQIRLCGAQQIDHGLTYYYMPATPKQATKFGEK
ncbi:MAG: hypothetical protein A2Z45_03090 [Chloroflexi bacterium RBG_19FT_COMBO_55_16]|nr:MAG: hypothetical protein A2Z45_03090 [Chloroflexi bacterium RBG_19FT_COMBO_55_16]